MHALSLSLLCSHKKPSKQFEYKSMSRNDLEPFQKIYSSKFSLAPNHGGRQSFLHIMVCPPNNSGWLRDWRQPTELSEWAALDCLSHQEQQTERYQANWPSFQDPKEKQQRSEEKELRIRALYGIQICSIRRVPAITNCCWRAMLLSIHWRPICQPFWQSASLSYSQQIATVRTSPSRSGHFHLDNASSIQVTWEFVAVWSFKPLRVLASLLILLYSYSLKPLFSADGNPVKR